MSTYSINTREIDRRMVAFTDLLISLIVGLWTSVIVYAAHLIALSPVFVLFSVIGCGAMFFVFHEITQNFFEAYSKSKIILSDKFFERKSLKSHERIAWLDINRINILWTSRGDIRQIGIWTNTGRNIFIDGTERFEELKNEIVSRAKTRVRETVEPFDYDHQAFYPVLGFALGVGTILLTRFLVVMDYEGMMTMRKLFSLYTISIGVYFMLAHPLAKRYGYKSKKTDYIFGLILIAAAIIVVKFL